MKEMAKYIYYNEARKHENDTNRFYEPGFYFSDETSDLHGPYKTIGLAQVELENYIKELG